MPSSAAELDAAGITDARLRAAYATCRALNAAHGALSTKQRHAIALRYLAGCPEEEVAAALGVSTGTVKTHLRRGLDHLRRQLGEEAPVALGA